MNAIKSLTNFQAALGSKNSSSLELNKQNKVSFKETLSTAIADVNNLQIEAKQSVDKFLNGEIKDVHQVMIAAEKASVGLELTIEVRNKLLEAYREVMKMSG